MKRKLSLTYHVCEKKKKKHKRNTSKIISTLNSS